MPVTIKDIAKIAGVSHTTVSRALRGHPGIAPETVARIKKIAAELGYIPNTVARGLKTQRSGVVGVIVRRIVDPFFSEVLNGIEDTLQAAGYSFFLSSSNRDPEREKTIVRVMSERRVDGVIVCSSQVSEHHRRQLERFRVPTVLINNQAAEESAHSIYHDDVYGGWAVTHHLIELGHKRIAFLGNARGGRTSEERLRGYKQALSEAGLPIDEACIVSGPNGLAEGGAEGARRLLALPELPTGVVCYNDVMAIGVMRVLAEHGVHVPADCSVTGFDNIELAAYVNPPLTTFDQPKYELGHQAAVMLLRLLDGTADSDKRDIVVLRGELCPRESTAPPPENGRFVTEG
ncbi:MAG: LacI family transcriptional regulator [Chloroflexi bacterium]|nr:MAG: LacI family transcriptional regulator [Chloroflexota bacterium]